MAACTCGVTKTYGAGVGSSLHSDWCDISPMGLKRPSIPKLDPGATACLVKYCNWKHLATQKRLAVKIVSGTNNANFTFTYYACQACIDDYNAYHYIPFQFWDLNDPNAPTP